MTIEDQIKLFVSRMESTEEDEAIQKKICASFEKWLSITNAAELIVFFFNSILLHS